MLVLDACGLGGVALGDVAAGGDELVAQPGHLLLQAVALRLQARGAHLVYRLRLLQRGDRLALRLDAALRLVQLELQLVILHLL